MMKIAMVVFLVYPILFAQGMDADLFFQKKMKHDGFFPETDKMTPSKLTGTLHEPVNDSSYYVGPGDEFQIVLLGKIIDAEYSIAVDAEGNLLIPKIGSLRANKTFRELKKDIIEIIGTKIKNTDIFIQLVKIKSISVPVSGEIRFPGTYSFSSTVRLAEVIQKASSDPENSINYPFNASLRNVEVHSFDGKFKTYDFENYLLNGLASENPFISSGDRVVVPVRKKTITVSGAVGRPRVYDYRETSVSECIRLAGGFIGNTDTTSIFVTGFLADGVNLSSRNLKYPSETDTFRVQPDDNIIVGAIPYWHEAVTVTITGRVHNPGVYTLKKGAIVSDAITQAGGMLDDADAAVTYLNRPKYFDNQTSPTYRAGLNDLSIVGATFLVPSLSGEPIKTEKDMNTPLYDGDIIFIPKKINTVSVIGNVLRPGLISYSPGKNWEAYINEAGGYDNNAYVKYVKIYKKQYGGWIFAHGIASVEAGDILLIPSKPDEYNWNKFKDVITVTSGLISIGATLLILSRQ
ncbi:MAG: SLBB domain-containing protein [Fibrobacterota bacterium]